MKSCTLYLQRFSTLTQSLECLSSKAVEPRDCEQKEEEPLEDDESNAETAARVGLNPEGLSPEEEGLLPSGSQENLYVQVPGHTYIYIAPFTASQLCCSHLVRGCGSDLVLVPHPV